MSVLSKLNERLTATGARITLATGTMWVAIAFAALALISLPAVIRSGDVVIIVAWVTQSFLQLVLLPIIIVGQNVQGVASEARSAALAVASDQRAAQTLADVEQLLALQTSHIAAEHDATREHITGLIAALPTSPDLPEGKTL